MFFRKIIDADFVASEICVLLQSYSGCSAVGSVLRSGRRGRPFKSGHPDT